MDAFKQKENIRQSPLTTRLDQSVTVFSIVLWTIVIYYAYTQAMPRAQFGIAFMGIALTIYIFQNIIVEIIEGNRFTLFFLIISQVVITVTTVYLYLNFSELYTVRVGTALSHEYLLAVAFVTVILYITWRSFGLAFLFVLSGAILFAYFGPYFPGMFAHGGLSPERILGVLVLEIEGFYGFLTRLVAAWIALFLLFAGLLQSYGAFNLMFRMAAKSAKYFRSGAPQTAVIASSIIGSINGSQTANAGMTGSFTIPMMKRNGIKPATAGGIESVASTLGQVLPPVMGAGAFVMASLIQGVTYVDVILAGAVPAAILLICVAIAVHYIAINQITDIQGQRASIEEEFGLDESASRYRTLSDSVKFGVPLLVLIYTLGVLQWTVMTSALYTTIAMILTGTAFPIVSSLYYRNPLRPTIREISKKTVVGFREGALITAPVAIILASVNGVVDLLMATGVPGIISLTLIDLSGGVLFITMILAMIICVFLGLGMPTTAAYTIVAILVAPTFVNQFFVPDLAAHYFVFYAAIVSGLTPPVAACAAVAAGIAKANFWRTCLEALKISAPMYILPFSFIYHPEIVSGELTTDLLVTAILTLVGAIVVIHSIHYQFRYTRSVSLAASGAFLVTGAVVMVYPGTAVRMALAAILFISLLVEFKYPRLDPVGARFGRRAD